MWLITVLRLIGVVLHVEGLGLIDELLLVKLRVSPC